MKRGFAAFLLLLLLIGLSAWNVSRLDALTGEIEQRLALSAALREQGDFAAAERELHLVIGLWEENEGYTHIFLRHDEVSAVYDGFFALLGDLRSEDNAAADGDNAALLSRLESIRSMEHVSVKSVF